MEDEYGKIDWNTETIVEMVNDWLVFEFMLEIKRRIKNIEAKNYISLFLMTIAPVIVYEVAESLEMHGDITKKDFFGSDRYKRVQKEREKAIKKVIVKSSIPKLLEKEMGLNFKEKVYDINILVKNDELMDMNYEFFEVVANDDIEFWNYLFSIPRSIINSLLSNLYIDKRIDDIYAEIDSHLDKIAQIIEQEFSCQRYSYSVHKLFSRSNNLEDIDRILILYRYRMVTAAINFENVVPDFHICLGDHIFCDVKSFMRKYRAVAICIIGSELKAMKSQFSQSIQFDIENQIGDSSFWRINRKLRNNIHYQQTDALSKNEVEILDRFQILYFEIVLHHFKKNICLDIDKECETMTGFMNACYKKGLSKKDIDKFYYYYYFKYLLTGRV